MDEKFKNINTTTDRFSRLFYKYCKVLDTARMWKNEVYAGTK